MKIAFPVDEVKEGENALDVSISPVFGRARYFLIVDEESGNIKFVENPGFEMPNAAGMHAAMTLIKNSCEKVVVKNIGPKAKMALEEAGITIDLVGNEIVKVKDYLA